MSTIVASNISDGTNTVGTEYVVNGSAKAWVNFNGTGTIATRDSYNVSSLTDNGTGDYSVNLTNASSAVDMATLGSGKSNSAFPPTSNAFNNSMETAQQTTSAIRHMTGFAVTTSNGYVDDLYASISALGDLA